MQKRDPAVYNLVADESLVKPRNFAGLVELRETVVAIL